VVTDLLLESFDDIFDVKYTARMEEELDEIEEGTLDWRAAMGEFYGKFDKDLKHAEEHMTDIKRMEKPTDLVCEKCGKPLVIKWGKHGSFLACTGYPDLSTKSMEAALEKLEKAIILRRLKDSKKMESRLGKIQARYPEVNKFFDVALRDTPDGVRLFWRLKEDACTYTRELAVDLPDVDKSDLTEQGEEEYCENCGRPMVLKKGRFGQFYACTGYPDCKTTKPIGGTQKKADVMLDEACPQCGNKMVLKSGRFGEFTACSNYPTCKYVKQKTIGVKCPECSEGEVVERRSKRGKTFYGCNRYPDCDFVAWGKPVAEQCPECSGSYMIEKWLKAGPVLQCPNPECKFKKDMPVPTPEVVAV